MKGHLISQGRQRLHGLPAQFDRTAGDQYLRSCIEQRTSDPKTDAARRP